MLLIRPGSTVGLDLWKMQSFALRCTKRISQCEQEGALEERVRRQLLGCSLVSGPSKAASLGMGTPLNIFSAALEGSLWCCWYEQSAQDLWGRKRSRGKRSRSHRDNGRGDLGYFRCCCNVAREFWSFLFTLPVTKEAWFPSKNHFPSRFQGCTSLLDKKFQIHCFL